MGKPLTIGWAQTDITPDRPVYVIGQLFTRFSSYVHDPLTATCLVIENEDDQVTFVSLDMASVPTAQIPRIIDRLAIDGLDPDKVCFCVTHTHNATQFTAETTRTRYFEAYLGTDRCPDRRILEPDDILKDEEAEEFLITRIVDLITDAWQQRAPGGISYGQDYAAVAFNRRPQFRKDDGTRESRMYGACHVPSFTGLEGSSDHSALMLYTWDLDRQLTGILVNIPCPAQVCELQDFITADYWNDARAEIRNVFGQVFVLPLCGAAGDQNPLDLIRLSRHNEETLRIWNSQQKAVHRNLDMTRECAAIGRRIADAVSRVFDTARNQIDTRPVFKHERIELSVPIRRVTEEMYGEAKQIVEDAKEAHGPDNRLTEPEMIRLFEPIGVVNRWALQQSRETFDFPVFLIRIGQAAFATNPFELFCEYGFRIRARSNAEQTFIVQLSSNATGSYLPTEAAVAGGSYGAKPVSSLVGPDGGDTLVEATVTGLNKLFGG